MIEDQVEIEGLPRVHGTFDVSGIRVQICQGSRNGLRGDSPSHEALNPEP